MSCKLVWIPDHRSLAVTLISGKIDPPTFRQKLQRFDQLKENLYTRIQPLCTHPKSARDQKDRHVTRNCNEAIELF